MVTEDLVAESIGYKLRWLARELRWINDPSGIDKWVESVKSLCELRWKISACRAEHHELVAKRRNDQWTSLEKTNYTISPEVKVNIEERLASEERQVGKRGREWKCRDNWKDMNKDIEERGLQNNRDQVKPEATVSDSKVKPVNMKCTPDVNFPEPIAATNAVFGDLKDKLVQGDTVGEETKGLGELEGGERE